VSTLHYTLGRSASTCNLLLNLSDSLCRPYRAPELLFGSRSYDPFAIDRWALGATIASFFTTIGPTRSPSPDSDEPQMSFMSTLAPGPIVRLSFFEGGFSDFALIGSIFKTLGTPSLKTWQVSMLLTCILIQVQANRRNCSFRTRKTSLISANLHIGNFPH
jgi:serine/threonine protein kinase